MKGRAAATSVRSHAGVIVSGAIALSLFACGGDHSAASGPVATYTVGGAVSGLSSGASLVLQQGGGDNTSVFANGNFIFPTALAQGASYSVTVLTQPQGESCSVAPSRGTVNGANVTVSVACLPAGYYTIGGSVAGLLAGNKIVLQDDGANTITLAVNGSFAFSSPLAGGSPYAVTVLTPPPGQNCAITDGSGTIGAADVMGVLVNCAGNAYNVGGTVSGLLAGTRITLLDNGADALAVGNGRFTFPTPVASGSAYSTSLAAQLAGQNCTIAAGQGSVAVSAITDIAVTCTPLTYVVGGSVSGLATGNSVVLQDNGADATTVAGNTTFAFSVPVASGTGYAVTVQTQPASQACSITGASGTVAAAPIGNVAVNCASDAYNVGVDVSGLAGSGLVLLDNGGDALAVSANGLAYFATPLANGAAYAVTIGTQPGGQTCAVAAGSGTIASANPTIGVQCAALSGVWDWMNGSSLVDASGFYGTQGVAAPTNEPGARILGSAWIDPSGTFWLFGGYGYGASGSSGVLDDLWSYRAGQWTWVGGTGAIGASGSYGSGASPTNLPGARQGAAAWSDLAGNLWLFGGSGIANGKFGYLNDLWEYSGGQWTWVGGTATLGSSGIYGTQGSAAPDNAPGARQSAASWVDATGRAWLFGGDGVDGAGAIGLLNDLWSYSAGTWTWVAGANRADGAGMYGTQGQAAAGQTPGARYFASSWTDPSGNLWLFGGVGIDAAGHYGYLNDLWEFSAGQWTWVAGSDAINASGVYGNLGTASAGQTPGAREGASAWVDTLGNLWLFGGSGYDSAGKDGVLNDLWQFSAGQWKWVGGSRTQGTQGSVGTQGVAAAADVPGARNGAAAWIDSAGKLWLYGGIGSDSAGQVGYLSDLWRYAP